MLEKTFSLQFPEKQKAENGKFYLQKILAFFIQPNIKKKLSLLSLQNL